MADRPVERESGLSYPAGEIINKPSMVIPSPAGEVLRGDDSTPERGNKKGKSLKCKKDNVSFHKRKHHTQINKQNTNTMEMGPSYSNPTETHASRDQNPDLGHLILEGFKSLSQLIMTQTQTQRDEVPMSEEAGPSAVKRRKRGGDEDGTQRGDVDEFEALEDALTRDHDNNYDEEEDEIDEDNDITQELKELEQFFNMQDKYGDELHNSIAPVIKNSVNTNSNYNNREKIKKVMEKHLCPKNTPNLRVPRVNPQVWRMLPINAKGKDTTLQHLQHMMVKNITITAKLLNNIVMNNDVKQNKGLIETKTITPLVTDLLRVGSAIYSDCSQLRRETLKPHQSEECRELCKPNEGSSMEFLLGDNLDESVKSINERNKLTRAVTKPMPFRFDGKPKNYQGWMHYPSPSRTRAYSQRRGGRAWRSGERGGARRRFQRNQNNRQY